MHFQVQYQNTILNSERVTELHKVVEYTRGRMVSVLPHEEAELLIRLHQHSAQEYILSFSMELWNRTIYLVTKGFLLKDMIEHLFGVIRRFVSNVNKGLH